MMTTMMGRRISQAALFILWGVALVALSSHSTAQARVGVHSRLPTRKVRGSSMRDLKIGGVVDNSAPEDFFTSGNSKSKGADKTIRVAPTKSIETVTRPAMISSLKELNNKNKNGQPPILPESSHGSDITVSKINEEPKGNDKTRGGNNETPKGNDAKGDRNNNNENVVENGAEHFQAGENLYVMT